MKNFARTSPNPCQPRTESNQGYSNRTLFLVCWLEGDIILAGDLFLWSALKRPSKAGVGARSEEVTRASRVGGRRVTSERLFVSKVTNEGAEVSWHWPALTEGTVTGPETLK